MELRHSSFSGYAVACISIESDQYLHVPKQRKERFVWKQEPKRSTLVDKLKMLIKTLRMKRNRAAGVVFSGHKTGILEWAPSHHGHAALADGHPWGTAKRYIRNTNHSGQQRQFVELGVGSMSEDDRPSPSRTSRNTATARRLATAVSSGTAANWAPIQRPAQLRPIPAFSSVGVPPRCPHPGLLCLAPADDGVLRLEHPWMPPNKEMKRSSMLLNCA